MLCIWAQRVLAQWAWWVLEKKALCKNYTIWDIPRHKLHFFPSLLSQTLLDRWPYWAKLHISRTLCTLLIYVNMYIIHSVTRRWNVRKLQMVVATCTIYQKSSLHCVLAPLNNINSNDFSKIWSMNIFFCYFYTKYRSKQKPYVSLALIMKETQTFNHKTFIKKPFNDVSTYLLLIWFATIFCNITKRSHKIKISI